MTHSLIEHLQLSMAINSVKHDSYILSWIDYAEVSILVQHTDLRKIRLSNTTLN